MLNIHTLTLGAYQVNCYIVHDAASTKCLVIDPGYEPEAVLDFIHAQQLEVEAILLTHGHFDHVGGVKPLAADTGCRVFLCPADTTMPPRLTAGKLYYTDSYEDGDQLTLAGLTFWVLHTPGHTPGSVCLIFGDVIFSGDTLFAGSCGRTDLPGGDWETIRQSLSRLAGLGGEFTIYPGHGEATTLAAEQQYNPYL